MIKTYINPSYSEWASLTKRPTVTYESLEPLVASVFESVKKYGDQSIINYTDQFDGIKQDDFRAKADEFKKAHNSVPDALKKAIQNAKTNIASFHRAQLIDNIKVTTQEGVECWQEKKPIEKVGLYIPGGSAPLFSTILMLAIPAQIAGCKEIVLCSPPSKDGTLPAEVLYTAQLCGVKNVYKIGGIHCLLYTSPSPRDLSTSRMPSSA